ncbi:PWWP domain-containing DNA repair factor 3A isoform X2 [Oryzias melastigma]|uniref:PWWP domain-containing protein MUM1-like n=1 Tax=Oryzias melastigma TaxID=30732 RepID=A0A3B3BY73_ORYME|nr:PWWP domain-containing DNA repair factor 3A isoform X2 [Oryzias melastigma]
MNGGVRKTRKREIKKKCTETGIPEVHSAPAVKESSAVADNLVTRSLSSPSSPSSPSKRCKRQAAKTPSPSLTSTPVRYSSRRTLSNISSSRLKDQEKDPQHIELIAIKQTSEMDSSTSSSKSNRRKRKFDASQPKPHRQGALKEQANGSSVKRPRGRPRKNQNGKLSGETKRERPRFELEMSDAADQDESLSSDLSIELSPEKSQLPSLPLLVDEQSEDEEDNFPSYLTRRDKKSSAITEGTFAWCKCRNYPFWPSLVKSVNRRQRKASIMFVDDESVQKKKGFTVALKSLKPFDCEEANELIHKAKENYNAAVSWALALIKDYTFRKACSSFSGSFLEYLHHDMSYPVRRMFPSAASEGPIMTASDSMIEEPCNDPKETSSAADEEKTCRNSKRLLPDRSHAAHNRANQKLVHFIVNQRMVEKRLLAVISGQQQSKWLHSFLSAKPRQVERRPPPPPWLS